MEAFIFLKFMEKVIYRTGPGICELLTVAFVILKLTSVINWSWWWVFAPLWIPICIGIVVAIICFIIAFIIED